MAASTIVGILVLVFNWLVYKKMGREGWESLIPFYSQYVLCEELYGNGWKFLLMLIPFYNIYFAVKLCIDLAHAFNKETAFGIGILLLNVIFMGILACDSSIVYRDGSRA